MVHHIYIYIYIHKILVSRISHCGLAEMNLTGIHKDSGLIPGLTQ